MSDALIDQLGPFIEEAIELRFWHTTDGVRRKRSLPPSESGPSEVLESLGDTRAALDRVEEILGVLVRIRARAQRASQAASAAAKDAWDQAARKSGSGGARRDVGPRERYSDFNLDTLNEQMAERSAQRDVSQADEALEVVRLAHRGLDGLRLDHHRILGALTFESRLER